MTIPDVSVRFVSEGVQNLVRDFGVIEQRAGVFEQRMARGAATGSRERVAASQREVAGRISGMDRLAKLASRVERDQVRATQQAEREKARAANLSAKERDRANATAAKSAERHARQEAHAVERAEKDKTRAVEREAKRREGIIRQSSLMAGRIAAQQARAESRAAEVAARKHGRTIGGIAGRGFGGAGGMLRGAVSGATQLLGAGLALGGGFAVADVVQSQIGAERAAINLSNSAYIPGQNERPDKDKILARAKAVQAGTNIDKAELIRGWQAYTAKSSDFNGGGENLMEFAKLAKATGSDFGQVMDTAGALRTQNENLDPAQLMQMMRSIVGAGKLGAIEMPDLARVGAKLTASSAMYGGDQAKAQSDLLGLAQIAIKTSASPEEAATAVERLGSDALTPGRQAKGVRAQLGFTATDKDGKLKSVGDLIPEAMAAAGGNLGKLDAMGFGDRSLRVFEALAPMYQEAEKKKKGSGKERVAGEVKKFTGASYSQEDIDKDMAAVMSSKGEKIDAAMTRLKEVVADKILPHLERFVAKLPELLPKVEKFIDSVGKVADFFVDNPFNGIGLVVSAAIVAEMGKAAIGKALESALQTNLGSKFAAGGMVIASAALAIQVGKIAIDTEVKDGEQTSAGRRARAVEAGNISRMIASGTASPADIKRGEELAEQLKKDKAAEDAQKPGTMATAVHGGVGGIGAGLNAADAALTNLMAGASLGAINPQGKGLLGQTGDQLQQYGKDQTVAAQHRKTIDTKDTVDALSQLTTALKDATAAAKAVKVAEPLGAGSRDVHKS